MDRQKYSEKFKKEKFLVVHQKANRNILISNLPNNLGKVIESCNYIVFPEAESVTNTIRSKSIILSSYSNNENIDKEDKTKFKNNFYKEVSWEEQVDDIISKLGNHFDDKDAYLWFLTKESPVICVQFGWAKYNFKNL